ncbi:methyl-accepting chemotaxis protein [Agrobacterium vitis]|uniref:methyl-accepting chemotaxis protein n=1 Tax=Agrobacterium vitis TaxID=373 RepID=UPI0008DC08D7|nr:nitrate- and nitrite sensing domain-containing protein [Agrobacterium vitis]MUO85307.1 HAMP domain-containing protein [Agrobacterium vitis]
MRITNFSINKRLWLAIIVPLVAALTLASMELASSWNSYRQMETVVKVSENITSIGEIIHAMQGERGQSAGYIGTKGDANREPLQTARLSTDEALAKLPGLAKALADFRDAELERRWASAQERVQNLPVTRQSIDSLAYSGKQSFDFYSGLIGEFSALASDLSLQGVGSRIASEMIAYNLLMQAKEIAGQERATGNGFITSGNIDPERIAPFARMAGAQNVLIDNFLALQQKERQSAYASQLSIPASKEIETTRSTLIGISSTAASDLSADRWFAAASQRIDAMKALETASLERLGSEARAIAAAAFTRLVTVLILCVAGAILVIASSMLLARTISQPLKALVQSMRRLAEGHLETTGQSAERKDEVGDMVKAVEVFRLSAIRNRELELAAEHAREQAERDRVDMQIAAEAEAEARMNKATGTLAQALRKLAAGDLLCEVNEAFAPQFEELRHDFNRSVEQLRQALVGVGQSVATVTGGASEVSSASDDLSRRTEQQAASLEETAAAIEQITANVTATSRRSGLARSVTMSARERANRSGDVVRNAVAAMDKIEQASSQISQIIGVIDQIAFQTNLLALNAGVEAARAGEAGKGFAVVAQEVRELAQRSAQAAREISVLIGNSELAVRQGVELVSETGTGLAEIDGLIQDAAAHVDAIAVAAQEQAIGLSQVNVAVNHLDQSTQQNAAMVEEMSAAGAALASESNSLQALLHRFRLISSADDGITPERMRA